MPTVAETFALAWQHHQAGNLDRAAHLYRQIVHVDPSHADSYNRLGMIAYQVGDLKEAEAYCREVLRLRPDAPEAHNNLGNALRAQGKLEDAVNYCREALRLRPDFAEAGNNLGTALAELGRTVEAVACLRETVRHHAQFAAAWSNLGNALALQDNLDEAAACYQQAISLQPGNADAHANLGQIRVQQGHYDAAQICFNAALHEDARHPQAHYNQALLWLRQGKWPQAWQEYEWRWQTKEFPPLPFHQPRWDGSRISGTLLLVAEQGLGDTIQFIRYAPLVRQRVDGVIALCQPVLQRLLGGVAGVDELIANGDALANFDTYAPLLSLPAIVGQSLESVPAPVPYVHADAHLRERWRREIRKDTESHFLVGIGWQGNPAYPHDRQRSIPLKYFGQLADLPGVQIISLQKGPGTDQLRNSINDCAKIKAVLLDETSGPFVDTAALMMTLDLMITSDTAVAHLAGALGVPVWIALPAVPDWRWLLEREDTPWYPTMRLFRQTRYGCWADVFDSLTAELRKVVQWSADAHRQ
jgi:tetratricopeptide (TPR) repeat protein